MPTIDTLVEDIYDLFRHGKTDLDHGALTRMGDEMAKSVARTIEQAGKVREGDLRMSSIGKPVCQLWYDYQGAPKEELQPHTYIKFIVGHLLEELVLYLAHEAGHEVTCQQKKIEVSGVPGHMDAKIDGVVTDAKSASKYGFQKFERGDLEDDSFGYVRQISGYGHAEGETKAAFLAVAKELGKLCLMEVDVLPDMEKHIEHIKEVVKCDEPPSRCYDAVPDGKSGNMKLGVVCSYCDFKKTCWEDANGGQGLRMFFYSTGPRWLTEVVRVPDVGEGEV